MRRLARWTLNALTLLSLVLCVAACALWVRSWRLHDEALWGLKVGSVGGYGYESACGVTRGSRRRPMLNGLVPRAPQRLYEFDRPRMTLGVVDSGIEGCQGVGHTLLENVIGEVGQFRGLRFRHVWWVLAEL